MLSPNEWKKLKSKPWAILLDISFIYHWWYHKIVPMFHLYVTVSVAISSPLLPLPKSLIYGVHSILVWFSYSTEMVPAITTSVPVAPALLPCGCQLHKIIQWDFVLTLLRAARLPGVGVQDTQNREHPHHYSFQTVVNQMVIALGCSVVLRNSFIFSSILLKSFRSIACDKMHIKNCSIKGAPFSVDNSAVVHQLVGHKNCG